MSCAQDYQLCSKDDDVDDEPEENEKRTDDDEDSTCCNSTSDDDSTTDEATRSRSDKESDLAYIHTIQAWSYGRMSLQNRYSTGPVYSRDNYIKWNLLIMEFTI